MFEAIITIVTTDESDIPITQVKRIEFNDRTALNRWVNRCADGESPLLDGRQKGIVVSSGVGVRAVETLVTEY